MLHNNYSSYRLSLISTRSGITYSKNYCVNVCTNEKHKNVIYEKSHVLHIQNQVAKIKSRHYIVGKIWPCFSWLCIKQTTCAVWLTGLLCIRVKAFLMNRLKTCYSCQGNEEEVVTPTDQEKKQRWGLTQDLSVKYMSLQTMCTTPTPEMTWPNGSLLDSGSNSAVLSPARLIVLCSSVRHLPMAPHPGL